MNEDFCRCPGCGECTAHRAARTAKDKRKVSKLVADINAILSKSNMAEWWRLAEISKLVNQ